MIIAAFEWHLRCQFQISGIAVSCWSKIINSVIVGGDGRDQNRRFCQMENSAVYQDYYIPRGQKVYVWMLLRYCTSDDLQKNNLSLNMISIYLYVYAKSIFTLESIFHTWGQPQNLRSNWHLALAKSSSHFPRLNWLVGWNMNCIFPYIGKNHPNLLSYFSEGLKPSTSSMFHNMRPLRVHVPIDLSRTPFG